MRAEFLDDEIIESESDCLWRDRELVAAIAWAERTLAERLHLIVDSTTATICRITIAAVDGVFARSYLLSPLVLKIERLKYSGVTSPLVQTTEEELDRLEPGWDEAVGTPTAFFVNRGTITFNKLPDAAATVTMTVTRKPSPLTLNSTTELQDLDDQIIVGALSRAYLKQDSQALNPGAADKYKGQFDDAISVLVREQAGLTKKGPPIMRPEPW
jgi:hypothetical protein